MISNKIKVVFDKSVDAIFAVILLFIIIGIAIGTLQLFVTTWKLLAFKGITGHYIDIIADVLTLYVLIELSRSLVEYFNTHRLRLTFIVDGAIVFVIREILIALFKHDLKPDMFYAFSAFLFVLGALRIASVLVYQREKHLAEQESH
ncbi:phosphate-starvation-inducible PsiE family protein [Pseudoalteromonas sp. DL2-H2.2]|uniref:phosphate-starvation-inducible PsiE family protein n=1 Tax=Pseudoalteromonas sp. DL2-H2.2 TaxID=2908889 RepID=UPI001F32B35B|nr:phosphate-starvation-inducible PsiE family protein [Pseudoalteromonas sp. DL2-H2.2]MCF2909578.1 phosphate-starvation-inducible PsiE family protein [Pseudoalteromonas sp. DL2-H2.2]